MIIPTVPFPTSVVVTPPSDTIYAGVSFNLTCTVNLSPTVDDLVTVNIVWTEPNEATLTPTYATMENLTQYINIAMFISDLEADGAEYQCTAEVSSNSSFVTKSINMTGTEKVEVGKIMLNIKYTIYLYSIIIPLYSWPSLPAC